MITSFIKHNSVCILTGTSALFTATRDGWPQGKVCKYASAKSDLAATGLPGQESGLGFSLLYTVALRRIRRDTPSGELAQWMSLSDAAVQATYRRVQHSPETLA